MKYYSGDQSKKNEVDEAYCKYGGDAWLAKRPSERGYFGDLDRHRWKNNINIDS